MSKRNKLIYVSGKYTEKSHADIARNISVARTFAMAIWEKGFTAICPHLNSLHFEDDTNLKDRDYLDGDLRILRDCDAIFMLPNWKKSMGAIEERDSALKQRKKVLYTLDELDNWGLE